MTTEIMTSVLAKMNCKMEAAKRKITLFMDNPPCHLLSLSDCSPNATVVFLVKNTTSRLQLLDVGIIKNLELSIERSF